MTTESFRQVTRFATFHLEDKISYGHLKPQFQKFLATDLGFQGYRQKDMIFCQKKNCSQDVYCTSSCGYEIA